MKNNTIKLLTIAVGLFIATGYVQAASMDYTLTSDATINLPNSGSLLNQSGRVWFGNFGNLSASAVDLAAGSNYGLLDSFRGLTSFEVGSGSLLGLDLNGQLRGTINVGDTSFTGLNFAGQDAYILALSSPESNWTTALATWKASGDYNAILIRTPNTFKVGTPDPVDFEVYASPNTGAKLIYGIQTASTITASTVPEPSVATLVLFGIAGLGALRFRRNKV
jgi:hypothetical protein